MRIVNRTPTLPERGKIKIGMKGAKRTSAKGTEFQPPQKLDHFIVTTMERDSNDNFLPDRELMQAVAQRTGQDAAHLTRIPVRLLYNDVELNMATRYAAYNGRTKWCSGDGASALRLGQGGQYAQCACPCERIEAGYAGPGPACKINGNLGVLIDGAPGVGGVWRFRTTSFNSVDGLMGSMAFMLSITGGRLRGLPLNLVLQAKRATTPDGKQQTIYVVGLEFGGSLEELRDEGYQQALLEQQANVRIEQVEADARKMLSAPAADVVFEGEDADDIVPEFYPEDEQRGPDRTDAPEQNGAPPPVKPPDTGDEAPAEPPRRGRGRPRGSRNKPKEEPASASSATDSASAVLPEQTATAPSQPEQTATAPSQPEPPTPEDEDLF